MSRGLGKLQAAILALLDGSAKHMVYASSGGPCDTRELLDELEAAGLLEVKNQKQAMFTVRRACRGLYERGLVTGVWTFDEQGRDTVSWSAVPKKK